MRVADNGIESSRSGTEPASKRSRRPGIQRYFTSSSADPLKAESNSNSDDEAEFDDIDDITFPSGAMTNSSSPHLGVAEGA